MRLGRVGLHSMNLKHHMELGGTHLLEMLSPPNNYLPYFDLLVASDGAAQMNRRWKAPSHNVPRWWDAMLRLERAIGFVIPAPIEAAMLQNLHMFTDNPDGLCLPPPDFALQKPGLDLHTARETFMAFDMLVRRRHSRWARRKGRHAIRTLLRGLRDDGTWDTGQFEYASLDVPNLSLPRDDQHPTSTNGRMLEALIWFYESTGESEAMELADRVARIHLKRTVQESGLVRDDDVPDHTHSYLNTLRGLILYGELTNQRQVIDIIRQTYHGTVKPKVLRPSGFANHDFGKDTKPDTASCGDAVQIALWLSRFSNDALLDDVERLVRCRLIPCQVVKEEDLYPVPEADDSDNYRDLSRRFIGALGGIHNEPHGGKRGTTDVSAAVLHTLIDVYENIVVRQPAGLTVQFHFDYEDGEISIRSTRNGRATVTAVLRHPQNLLIRVPGWASPDSVTFDVAGKSVTPLRLGTFAFFAGEQMTGPITLTYDLPRSTTEEDIDGTHFTTQWRGDEILGISPNTDYLPIYPTAP